MPARPHATAPEAARPWVLATGDTVITRPSQCDPRLAQLLADAEITFTNLEAPLTTRGSAAEKAATHRACPEAAGWLTELGITAVSLANNHAMDYGPVGLSDTITALTQAGIAAVGAADTLPAAMAAHHQVTSRGTVALLGLSSALPPGFAATATRPGVAPLRVLQQIALDPVLAAEQPGMAPYVHTTAHAPDLDEACAAVEAARREAEVVIVAMHWGVPHGFAAASYGTLAEYQRPVGHALIDAGATVVLGHHPHVVHPIEIVGGGLIAYSVGNLMFHNWDHFSGTADQSARSRPTSSWAGDNTGLFPLEAPAAPYRSAFNAPETRDSVVVQIMPPDQGRLTIQFLPTTMHQGDPVIPGATHCHTILDRLENHDAAHQHGRLTRRTDMIDDAVIGEVQINA